MIALIWFLVSLICVLVYIVMRLNWRINALGDENESLKDKLGMQSRAQELMQQYKDDCIKYGVGMLKLSEKGFERINPLDTYDKSLHDFNDSCDFEPTDKKV